MTIHYSNRSQQVWAWTTTASGTAAARCGNAKYLMELGVAWGLLLAAFRTGRSSTAGTWYLIVHELFPRSPLALRET